MNYDDLIWKCQGILSSTDYMRLVGLVVAEKELRHSKKMLEEQLEIQKFDDDMVQEQEPAPLQAGDSFMKFSELKELFYNYEQARWSPTRMNVHFGCDCGCGGDTYTQESWDAKEEEAHHHINIMKAWCDAYDIEWDGEE